MASLAKKVMRAKISVGGNTPRSVLNFSNLGSKRKKGVGAQRTIVPISTQNYVRMPKRATAVIRSVKRASIYGVLGGKINQQRLETTQIRE